MMALALEGISWHPPVQVSVERSHPIVLIALYLRLFRQSTYVVVGMKMLQMVPSLLSLTCDADFIRGEQTILVSCPPPSSSS